MTEQQTEIEAGSLIGWRAIHQYLGVCDRTARRWHESAGLPVMTTPGRRVMTTKSLIDQWVMARAKLRWQAQEARRQAKRSRSADSDGQDSATENQGVRAGT